jgi:hypothetical protein
VPLITTLANVSNRARPPGNTSVQLKLVRKREARNVKAPAQETLQETGDSRLRFMSSLSLAQKLNQSEDKVVDTAKLVLTLT